MGSDDLIKSTKPTSVNLALPQSILNVEASSAFVVSKNDDTTGQRLAKKKKEEEDPWRITPIADSSKLLQQYLMLSKFRLTCKFSNFILKIKMIADIYLYRF